MNNHRFRPTLLPVIGLMVLITGCGGPSPTPADTIIDEFGHYAAPVGNREVHIYESGPGQWKYAVETVTSTGMMGSAPVEPFQVDQAWFMAWDSRGGLWTYVEGDGVRRYYTSQGGGEVSMLVGSGGGWEGIPPAFLAKLPEAQQEVYRRYMATVAAPRWVPGEPE